MTDSKTTAITTASSRRKFVVPTITVRPFGVEVKPKTPFDNQEASFYAKQLAALDEDYEQVRAQAEFEEDHAEDTKHYGNPAYVRSRIHIAINSLTKEPILVVTRLVMQARWTVCKFRRFCATVEGGDVFDKWSAGALDFLEDLERFVVERSEELVGDGKVRNLIGGSRSYDSCLVDALPGMVCSIAQACLAEALLVRQIKTDINEMVASLLADPLAHITRRFEASLEIAGRMSLWRCGRCAPVRVFCSRFGGWVQKTDTAPSCRSTKRKVRRVLDEFVELITASTLEDLPRAEVIRRWADAKAEATAEEIDHLGGVDRMVMVSYFGSKIVGRILEERRANREAKRPLVLPEFKTSEVKQQFEHAAHHLVRDFTFDKIELILKLEDHVKLIATHDDATGHYVNTCFAENIARLAASSSTTPPLAAPAAPSFSHTCAFAESVLSIHKTVAAL